MSLGYHLEIFQQKMQSINELRMYINKVFLILMFINFYKNKT